MGSGLWARWYVDHRIGVGLYTVSGAAAFSVSSITNSLYSVNLIFKGFKYYEYQIPNLYPPIPDSQTVNEKTKDHAITLFSAAPFHPWT